MTIRLGAGARSPAFLSIGHNSFFEGAEYRVLETDNGQQALDLLNEEDIDILVTDLRLPILDGVELLKRAKALAQDLEVIMITGHGTAASARVPA